MPSPAVKPNEVINFARKLDLLSQQWTPRVVAELNDYQFKVVKLQGDFIWHDHKDTDETFIVIEGKLRIDFRRQEVEEQWENAVWEGNKLGGLPPEFWGDAKKTEQK